MNPRQRLLLTLAVTLAAGSAGVLAAPPPLAAVDYIYLTIQLYGTGSGSWRSTNAAGVLDDFIDCRMVNGYVDPRERCGWQYEPGPNGLVTVYYNVIPATGSCYRVSSAVCEETGFFGSSTTFGSDLSKSATFDLIKYTAGISRAGAGTGNVTSSPPGISCGSTCAFSFAYGTPLTLTAGASPGSYFAQWSGACAGQDATCELTVTGPIDATATFNLGSPPTASPPAPTQPVATPKVTVKPASTPKATAPATAQPATTVGPSETTGPTFSETAGATEAPLATAPASAGAGETPAASAPPVVPVAGSTDLTPIALAILGAGLLIALGIGVAGYLLMRRKGAAPLS